MKIRWQHSLYIFCLSLGRFHSNHIFLLSHPFHYHFFKVRPLRWNQSAVHLGIYNHRHEDSLDLFTVLHIDQFHLRCVHRSVFTLTEEAAEDCGYSRRGQPVASSPMWPTETELAWSEGQLLKEWFLHLPGSTCFLCQSSPHMPNLVMFYCSQFRGYHSSDHMS